MTPVFFSLLGSALKIWEHKNANKYFEEWRELMRIRYAESNKPINVRDMSIIDNADFELYLLAGKYQTEVGRPNFADKPG